MKELERKDALQKARQAHSPLLPQLLMDISNVRWANGSEKSQEIEKIKALFPLTSGQPFLKAKAPFKAPSRRRRFFGRASCRRT
jgi:hypothetical protein